MARSKKVLLIILTFFLLLIVLAALSPDDQDMQETTKGSTALQKYDVYFDLKSEQNVFFAKYQIDVYCDDVQIGSIQHGNHFTKTISIEEGEHSLSLRKTGDSSVSANLSFDVTGSCTIQCLIHSNSDSIDIKEKNMFSGIVGVSFTMPDVLNLSYEAARVTLSEIGFANITYVTVDDAWILDEAAWTVTNQTPEAGATVGKYDEIKLICEKPGYEFPDEVKENEVTNSETPENEQTVSYKVEYAKRAAVTAMTNYYAMDVFTADGNAYDISKYHSYSDTSGNMDDYYLHVKDWGSWTASDETTWHVDKLELISYQYRTPHIVSLNVKKDGDSYIISNVTGINPQGSEQLSFEESSPAYTVSQAQIDSDRADMNSLKEYTAHRAVENYCDALFPYGYECHWYTGLHEHTQYSDGSWYLEVETDVTNQYGTDQKVIVSALVNNTTQCVEQFKVAQASFQTAHQKSKAPDVSDAGSFFTA